MAMTEYECRFASEVPFVGSRYVRDPDDDSYFPKMMRRLFEGRLQVNPEMMFADLSTPNGIPVLWAHGSWDGRAPAVGRVLSMEFSGKELVGTIGVRDEDLRAFVAGGVGALNDQLNKGLSVGVQFLDNPPVTWKDGEGNREKPDQMTYGALRILEVSLTPTPRIANAGILKRIGGDEPAPNDDERSDDEDEE